MTWSGDNSGGCGCGLCGEINGLFINEQPIPSTVYLPLLDPDKGCSRTTLANLLAAFTDEAVSDLVAGAGSHKIATHTDVAGNVVDLFETVTLVDGENFNAATNVVSFDYTDEAGTKKTISWDLSGLAIDINVASMTYDPLTGQLVVTETDGTPHAVTIAAGVVPEYTTCAGAVLKTTDKILLTPTGAYADGYSVNQAAGGECAAIADIHYLSARRSVTVGRGRMSNDAQGYGSTVAGGLRNVTAAAASYSFVGGGYDHSITTGTSQTIGGGRNNDITAGNYNTIVGGYNIDITAGSYNVVGGVSHDVAGSYNATFGTTNILSGGYSFATGRSNTLTSGNYVNQLGYSHLNTAGGGNTQAGYNHTNTRGSYNSQTGYGHVIDVGQSVFQAGQSNRNRAGNYNAQIGYSHDNVAGSGNTLVTYNNTNTAGNYNFLGGVNGINRSGSYNAQLGYSHDNTGTGNMLFGYNNTANANYSVSIGRNLNNVTTDGVMIANTFQKLGFYGAVPVAKQALPAVASPAQLTVALRNLGLVN